MIREQAFKKNTMIAVQIQFPNDYRQRDSCKHTFGVEDELYKGHRFYADLA